MPTVSFHLRQQTSVLDGPIYRARQEITSAQNSGPQVFCFRTSTGVFDHVATIKDMRTWPTSQAEAEAALLEFYRQAVVQRDWPTVAAMVEDVNTGAQRVQLLASELTREAGLLEIDRTLTLVGA